MGDQEGQLETENKGDPGLESHLLALSRVWLRCTSPTLLSRGYRVQRAWGLHNQSPLSPQTRPRLPLQGQKQE